MATKQPTMPRALLDLDEFTESQNWLIFGDSGVGKTAEIGTLPDVMVIAAEPGTVTIKRFLASHGIERNGIIKVWPIKVWQDYEEAYVYLRDSLEAGNCPFKWVVIDSITSVQQKALRAILGNAVKDNPNRDPDIPAIQDHQKWQNIIKRFVVDFNDLPINTVWTAQVMRAEDAEGDDVALPLLLGKQGDIAAWVCAQMHVVTYFERVAVKGKTGKEKRLVRRMMMEGVPPYFSKDRYQVFKRYEYIADDHTQYQTLADLVARVDEDPEAMMRANRDRNAAVAATHPDRFKEEDEDAEDEQQPETDEVAADEETTPEPPVARKAAAKKPAAKRATAKFRASTEEE